MSILILQLIALFAIAVFLGNLVPVVGGGVDGLGVYLFFHLVAPLTLLSFLAAKQLNVILRSVI